MSLTFVTYIFNKIYKEEEHNFQIAEEEVELKLVSL